MSVNTYRINIIDRNQFEYVTFAYHTDINKLADYLNRRRTRHPNDRILGVEVEVDKTKTKPVHFLPIEYRLQCFIDNYPLRLEEAYKLHESLNSK